TTRSFIRYPRTPCRWTVERIRRERRCLPTASAGLARVVAIRGSDSRHWFNKVPAAAATCDDRLARGPTRRAGRNPAHQPDRKEYSNSVNISMVINKHGFIWESGQKARPIARIRPYVI